MKKIFLLLLLMPLLAHSQIINTICGTGVPGYLGDGGPATSAKIYQPWGIKLDAAGNVIFADFSNSRVRKISTTGIITTIAGNGTAGFVADGVPATSTELNYPIYVETDAAGNVYIADYNNNRIRKVDPAGMITTFAGKGTSGFSGDGGAATLAELDHPSGISMDAAGNLYIADYYNARIRKVDPSGIITTFAGSGSVGAAGDGGPATAADISNPYSVYADHSGNVFIADGYNNLIRKITSGIITTVAGGGSSGLGDGGPATDAQIDVAVDITSDASGNLFISDGNASRIRAVSTSGIISTITGTGVSGYNGDAIPATTAKLNHPGGVTISGSGMMYVADWNNNRIRTINLGPAVSPIVGPDTVCLGATVALSDPTPGGVWRSSNTAIATVSGSLVHGVAAGVDTVRYSVTNTYGTTVVLKTVTVVPTPNAGTITGASSVCTGAAITLSDALVGGAWSSGTSGVATVSGTGVVSGLSAGTAVVTYSRFGCISTATVTVSAVPAITGDLDLCIGVASALSNVTGSGTWSSSNTAVAAVGSTTGIATGISAGTATISFFTSGCYAVATVTVNTSPAAITGTLNICPGKTTALTDATTGGTWASSNTGIATVGGGDGIVTGIAGGQSVISYTALSGCIATTTVTVVPLPDAGLITGSTDMCKGGTTTLSDYAAGGVWSTGNTSVTLVGPDVTAVTTGTAMVTYTVSNMCGLALATKIITIIAVPNPGTISGPGVACKDATLNLTSTKAGGTWTSGDTSVAVIGSTSGVVTTLSTGTTMITYTTSFSGPGCSSSTTFEVTVTPFAPFFINGLISEPKCNGGHDGGITVTIDSSTGPFQYLWSDGSTLSYLNNITAGNYSLQVKDAGSHCSAATVYSVGQPAPLLLATEIKADFCKAGNGSVSVLPSGGTAPYQYLWFNGTTKKEVSGLYSGSYVLTVTDANTCPVSFTAIIPDSCNDIIIPDVITPNGDGINDTWVISGLQKYPGCLVQVFDKWGSMVYEKIDYYNEWKGQGTNGDLPSGTYFYLVKLNASGANAGKSALTGSVMIKR